ncbi:MAG: hypothetical protein RL091_1643 [Verrucomicrobiota bacterium]
MTRKPRGNVYRRAGTPNPAHRDEKGRPLRGGLERNQRSQKLYFIVKLTCVPGSARIEALP